MSNFLNTYLIGFIDCADKPVDLESMVQAINYLRAKDLKIMVGSAKVVDGRTRFPFIAEEQKELIPSLFSDQQNQLLEGLRAMFSEYGVHAKKTQPTTSNAKELRAIAQVAALDPRNDRLNVEDLKPAAKNTRLDDPFGDLIGLDAQKRQLTEIGNAVALFGRESLDSLHMCFTGMPGVGKTEAARRLHHYLEQHGVLRGGPFVQASAQELIGQYVGHTPGRVAALFDRAEGGILFIDEAYRLSEGEGNHFGLEAVNTIVQLLDERRHNTICIFAGYPEEMGKMLAMNPGLHERIGFHVDFPSYSADELADIFALMMTRKGFKLGGSEHEAVKAAEAIRSACRTLMGAKAFANARSIRRLCDRAIIKAALRSGQRVLRAEDIASALADADMAVAEPARKAIGFTA